MVVKHGCGSTITLFFSYLYKEGGKKIIIKKQPCANRAPRSTPGAAISHRGGGCGARLSPAAPPREMLRRAPVPALPGLQKGTPAFRFRCDNTSGMCKPPCTGATRGSTAQGGVWELTALVSSCFIQSNFIPCSSPNPGIVETRREGGERCH